jgi:hypothetical protein
VEFSEGTLTDPVYTRLGLQPHIESEISFCRGLSEGLDVMLYSFTAGTEEDSTKAASLFIGTLDMVIL